MMQEVEISKDDPAQAYGLLRGQTGGVSEDAQLDDSHLSDQCPPFPVLSLLILGDEGEHCSEKARCGDEAEGGTISGLLVPYLLLPGM